MPTPRPLPGMAKLAPSKAKTAIRRAISSELEDALAFQVRALKLPRPVREHRFATEIGRQWRWDLAWPEQMLAVEIQGGGFVQGRHGRGAGLEADAEKISNGTLLGWRILLCTGSQVKSGLAVRWIWDALGGAAAVQRPGS